MATSTGEESCCPPGSIGAPSELDEQPIGSFVTVGSSTQTPCYYVGPEISCGSSSSSSSSSSMIIRKAMILFPDVWGFQSRILKIADWLSREASCHVLVCDFFRGETKDNHPDMKKWFESIPYDPNVKQDLVACMDYLKTEKGATHFGAMGFCWGGWAIAKSCQAGTGTIPPWRLVISPHPSFKIESWVFGGDDIALMHSMMMCPTLLMPAGNDPQFTKPDSIEFRRGMANSNAGGASTGKNESKSIPFEEMTHGWTTRGDMTDPKVKRDVEKALTLILEFVQKHL